MKIWATMRIGAVLAAALGCVLVAFPSSGALGESGQGNVKAPQGLVGRAQIGAKLFSQSECRTCHSINHQGSEVGPDLTQVGFRRSREWLVDFIYDPEDLFPDTKMPRFPWTDKQQTADVAAFLITLGKPVARDRILARGGAEMEIGKSLVNAFDCRACHRIHEGGLVRYPDLTHIGAKIYREWEHAWLLDPQKIKRGTFMPTFGFTEKEASAIAAYLESLK